MAAKNTGTPNHKPPEQNRTGAEAIRGSSDVREALCKGSDAVAYLMLVACGLSVARDGGDLTREIDADEQHLILTAASDLLDECIDALRDSYETLWGIS